MSRTSRSEGGCGERDALASLYDHHGAGIYRFLHSMLDDADRALELCQDLFLAQLPALVRGNTPSRAYLYRCARNAAASQLRRRLSRRRWLRLAGEEPGNPGRPVSLPRPDEDLERGELRAALLAALGELPEELRAVFLLIEVEGLSYRETAEATALPSGTVASRKHKALRMLREALGRSGHAL